jgi:hypothetical protein
MEMRWSLDPWVGPCSRDRTKDLRVKHEGFPKFVAGASVISQNRRAGGGAGQTTNGNPHLIIRKPYKAVLMSGKGVVETRVVLHDGYQHQRRCG